MSYDALALFPATRAYRWPATSAQGFILCANNEFHDANDQVLATALDGAMPRALERLLIGPAGCEITGPMLTPDRRTFLCSIQHPGSTTGFPEGAGAFARPAVVCVFRTDGGFIGA